MSAWVIPSGVDPLDYAAFVYMIALPSGQWYLGKKSIYVLKAGSIVRESDWRSYWSSSKEVKALVKQYGETNCQRIILRMCESRGKAGWCEAEELIKRNAMLDPLCLNGNVAERWNRKVVQDWHDRARCARYLADLTKQRKAAGLLPEA